MQFYKYETEKSVLAIWAKALFINLPISSIFQRKYEGKLIL